MRRGESLDTKTWRLERYLAQLERGREIAERRIGHMSAKRARIFAELERARRTLPAREKAL
jgi:hypothetical protein